MARHRLRSCQLPTGRFTDPSKLVEQEGRQDGEREMNVWIARCALISAAALIATSAEAAKWVQIGAIEYLDTDSVQRKGDIVSYNLFTVIGDARPDDTTQGVRYTLNCKTREEETPDFPGQQSEIVTKDEPIYRRLCQKK
jgi:hypothetical protein